MIHPGAAGGGESRRQFIRKTGLAAAAVAGAGFLDLPVRATESKWPVALVLDTAGRAVKEPPVIWATEQLRAAFASRGCATPLFDRPDRVPASMECVIVTANAPGLFRPTAPAPGKSGEVLAEAFSLSRAPGGAGVPGTRQYVLAAGSDARGLVYGLLELADRVTFAADPAAMLKSLEPFAVVERPANAIRGIARTFASEAEDKPWFQDREFWAQYLTLLAAQRFNRFHLMLGLGYDFTADITDCYFHFAYPFFLGVPGYDVRAVPLADAERDSNLAMLRFISDEAARRGLQFQLGIWTHAYEWTNSPKANYRIRGLTPETQAPYCREALRRLLTECPGITGVTLRTHGESGVGEGNTGFWKTVFAGAAECGRPVELDLHAKGMEQGIIDAALATGLRVTLSPKWWAEHMGLPYMQGAIRPQEMPRGKPDRGFFSRSAGSRSFLRYGYGDLLLENRRYGIVHRIWPGTQRLLAWADAESAAGYGRAGSFCGSEGVELMEPLSFKGRKGSGRAGGRNAYEDVSLKPAHDFEKYLLYYRIWGRALYDPDRAGESSGRWAQNRFGRGAEALTGALAAAGRILPLVTTAHCPSAANNNYWPEIYYNQPIVDASRQHPYGDTPSPKRFGTVTPLDPEFFLGVDEFAAELLAGRSSGKHSPAWVAAQISRAAGQARTEWRRAKWQARGRRGAEFRRLAADVAIQAGLGDFFAAKFRAGILFAIYQQTGQSGALEQAVEQYHRARRAWAAAADAARGVYVDDITFGPEYFQRGHWRDRLAAVDGDIADMERILAQERAGGAATKTEPGPVAAAVRAVLARPERDEPAGPEMRHTPAGSFRRGQELAIAVAVASPVPVAEVWLRYRHVNQAEAWQSGEMEGSGGDFQGVIPAAYTDSPFPLQYYFQIRAASGEARLWPGLDPGRQGQPYFVLRQDPGARG